MTRDVTEDNDSVQIFQLKPPEWLPKVHAQADLGYHGFQPPRPQQDEDLLSEGNVKNGLVLNTLISAEHYSAKDLVTQSLYENAIPELESLMSQIFARKAESLPTVPPPTFKLPSRVTLNEAKRQTWFADLANPEVPLQKLGKSVPHGAKGPDLLDLLHSNNVEIRRAIWFLRVFGGNETVGLRHKPGYNPTQYSVDWANVVTMYIKKQLSEIALPSAPRPGLNIKQTFKGMLSDPESRERWLSRFSYCLNLLHAFYAEGLVDNRTFLSWLVQQMSSCNLPQTGFVSRLADEYLDGMLVSRALTRPFVEACINKLSEIAANQAKHLLGSVEAMLRNILQRVCLALPDAFISPCLWSKNSALICEAIGEYPGIPESSTVAGCMRTVRESLYNNLTDIRQRCEAMLFQNLPTRELAQASWSVIDVQVLNSTTPQTDLESIDFLPESGPGNKTSSKSLSERIGILLVWSVTPLQYGEHRRYAVATLLRQWQAKRDERALRRDSAVSLEAHDEFLQDCLFDWLDSSEVAGDPTNISAVALLYYQLIKQDLFSYNKYTQRLIARGDVGLCSAEETGNRHRSFLKWIPLHDSSQSTFQERRVLLYGSRVRETVEELNEREIRREIRSVIPAPFAGDMQPRFHSITELFACCPSLLSATCFEQFKTLKQWLLPILKKFMMKFAVLLYSIRGADYGRSYCFGDQCNTVIKPYCIAVELLGKCKCYYALLEISLFLLERSSTTEQVSTVLDVLRRHHHIWASMNVTKNITRALFVAHQVYVAKGSYCRSLIDLLLDMDNDRKLEEAERQRLIEDIKNFSHALYPSNEPSVPVPPVLPEILLLTQDAGTEAPSILANSLWYKYRTAPDWAWKVWDNTVASLRQIPAINLDVVGRRICALRYANFLYHVDQHIPDGIDKHVLDWLLGPGKHELPALSSDVWDVLTVVLLDLLLHEALSTTTILRGLVYPAWQAGAAVSDQQQVDHLRLYLVAANSLFECLLLRDDGGDSNDERTAFTHLCDIQRLVTRRQNVYRENHFPLLLGNIPTLVSMEGNLQLPQDIRARTSAIRFQLCQLDEFRQGVYRDLTVVREAFENPLKAEKIPEALHESLVAALRLIFDDGSSSSTDIPNSYWRPLSSLLSPWKRAATAVELQFALRQLGEDMLRPGMKESACSSLDQLGDQIFSHSLTTEEADFVAVITQDAGPGVSGKFLTNGMKHISKTLDCIIVPIEVEQMESRLERAGDILRLITLIIEPFREADPQSKLCGDTQDKILPKLCEKFKDMAKLMEDGRGDPSQKTRCILFLARLLQFVLTTTVVWSSQSKQMGKELVAVLVRLILLYGSGDYFDYTAFSLLMDTLYYVIDDIPSDTKTTAPDLFRNYPDMNVSDLPPDMPLDVRTRIRALLPYVRINPSVEHLVLVSRDSSGGLVSHGPVHNRPWEWTEFLGDGALEKKDGDGSLTIDIKNSASLSLETFGAQLTGDRILPSSISSRTEDTIRSLRSDLSTESVFKRDWRESRLLLDVTGMGSSNPDGTRPEGTEVEEKKDAAYSSTTPVRSQPKSDSHSSLGVSPASSIPSRFSAGSFHTPAQASSASRHVRSVEVIDIDSLSASTSTSLSLKRKGMESIQEEDDEIQILENPPPASRAEKRPKTKATVKTRAKKK